MAFNTSDTRQRAYNPIDTSNPHGTWIEEKSYNKTRPGETKRVLCGNWQEEVALEGDMLSQGLPIASVVADGTRFKGGFESTPYLTKAVDPRERRPDMMTTQRLSFSSANGDVASQKQPSLGVRAAARSDQVLQLAKEALAESQASRSAASLQGSFVKGSSLSSTYSDAHGKPETKRVVTDAPQTYLADVPITLYNPQGSSKQMYVHGKTPENPTASVHAKHNGFTNEKYTIGGL